MERVHPQRVALRLSLLLTLLLLLRLAANGQPRVEYSTRNRRAIKAYEAASESFVLGRYSEAINLLEQAKKRDATFIEAYLLEAQIQEEASNYEQALQQNELAIRIDSLFYPKAMLDVARLAFYTQRYQQGAHYAQRYLWQADIPDKYRDQAQLFLGSCRFAAQAMANPLPINPEPLSEAINTQFDEYFPSLSADERTLVVTRLIPQSLSAMTRSPNRMQEDLFIARRASVNAPWETAQDIGAPVSTPMNEGAQSITADGQRMYFTRCQGPCNIFYADRLENGTWNTPRALPSPINLNGSSDKQPAISPDGKTLYFASSRPGGYGGYDLWCVSYMDSLGMWGAARNLGPTINTPFDEQSPFMHFDNETLYFSSNGHPGLGGLDLFKVRRMDDSTWGQPQNLGYPINTSQTDMGLIVAPGGHTAYYASSRNAATGLDIYSFTLPDSLRPRAVSYLLATVRDATTGAPLGAQCQLVDLESGEVIMRPKADGQGQFLVCLPVGRRYALFATHRGYFDHSLHFDFAGQHSATTPYEQQIGLMPIVEGARLTLSNVFFETASDSLSHESHVELDRWVRLLSEHPTMRIRIAGHTDNQGDAEYNKGLSLRRARSVVAYLEMRGVAPSRMECHGAGEDEPVASNDTPEGRAANRRTECQILAL